MAATYVGHPCKKCSGTLRYTREKRCVKCRRADDRARNGTPERLERDRTRNKTPSRKALQAKLRTSGYHQSWNRAAWLKDPRKRLLKKAKERAKTYGREFALSLEDIVVPKHCPLLGIPLKVGNRRVKNNSPTIDRKNSAKGYVRGNVWVISWRANRIKSDATLRELQQIVKNWP